MELAAVALLDAAPEEDDDDVCVVLAGSALADVVVVDVALVSFVLGCVLVVPVSLDSAEDEDVGLSWDPLVAVSL